MERREVPGPIALVAHGDQARVEVLGTPALDDPTPLRRDAVFRIASLTEPITAAAAMTLVEDGRLALSAPVETYLPELADRRVLRRLDGPLDDTVPAERSITVEDLLTNRLGFGTVVEAPPGTFPMRGRRPSWGRRRCPRRGRRHRCARTSGWPGSRRCR